jgi:RNA polymerase sigma-70 factor (ECF subfamily)
MAWSRDTDMLSPTWTRLPPPDRARDARLHALVDRHFDFVWHALCRLGVDDADDAAQRVFCITAAKIDGVEPGSERSFLFGVTRRVAADARRARRRRPEVADERAIQSHADDAPNPEERSAMNDARRVLGCALETMTDEARAAFLLVDVEGMTAPEAAEALRVPVGTVASRLRRARQELRAASERARDRTLAALGLAARVLPGNGAPLGAMKIAFAAFGLAVTTAIGGAVLAPTAPPPHTAVALAPPSRFASAATPIPAPMPAPTPPPTPALAPTPDRVPAPALGASRSAPAARSIDAELRSLEAARAALAAGDTARALAELDAHATTFAHGALADEATVLRAEVLDRRGDAESAGSIARRFADASPTSPYARRMRALAAERPAPSTSTCTGP